MNRRKRERLVLDSSDDDDAPALCTQTAPSHPAPSSQPTLGGLLSRLPLRPAPKRELAADAEAGPSAAPGASHLWCDKYEPRSADELAVAKKKLEAIRGWLTHQQTLGGGVRPGRCLVLSGPAGSGKSTAARLVAQAAGYEVMEWTPPMPTLWDEHASTSVGGHNGAGYTSKMEAFESWLDRSRTMAPLTLALATVSLGSASLPPLPLEADGDDDGFLSAPLAPLPASHPKLLLLEDIPLTAGVGGAAKQRLTAALTSLALASRYPSILCLTDSMASELGDDNTLGMRELAAALESSSAAVIAINPATRAELQKLLIRVAAAEGIVLAPNDAGHMAEAARGDIRAALSTLQMHCAGVRRRPGGVSQPQAKRRRTAKGGSEKAVSQQVETRVWERSDTLTVFHSLGKVLYAKRVPPTHPAPVDASGLLAQHVRLPLEVTSPEAVLAQAGLSASTALAFLHENAPDFVGVDAIEDYAEVVAYFSDAAVLLAPSLRGGGGGRGGGAPILAEVDDLSTGARAAIGVASRGYMFANAHPAPHTFRQIRGPAGTAVERDGRAQGLVIRRRVSAAISGNDACAGGSVTVAASQVLPYLRLIAVASPELAWCLPPRKAVGGSAGGDDAGWSTRGIDTAWDIDRGARAAALGGIGGAAGGMGQTDEEDPIEDSDT